MKKNNNNFVYVHITPDGMCYFGATNDIKRRWSGNGKQYKGTSLEPEIERWGWENIQHIVLFSNQSKEDALKIEDFLITTSTEEGNCINKNRSGYVTKEDGYSREHQRKFYNEHRDEWNRFQNEYIHENPDKKKEWNKKYYDNNKSYFTDYYKEHLEEIKEQQRNRYQRKKQNKQLKELGYIPLF